jgi:hypothetical protein
MHVISTPSPHSQVLPKVNFAFSNSHLSPSYIPFNYCCCFPPETVYPFCSGPVNIKICPTLEALYIYKVSINSIRAQFSGSAYRKHRIRAYGSRELCAYGKRISLVSGEFLLLRMCILRY